MNRLTSLVCGIALVVSPHTMLGQHRGGHGPGNSSGGASNSDDLKDFHRAVALQATPDQVTQFRRLTKSTQASREGAQDLLHLAENASKPDLLHSTDPLTGAVEEAQNDTEKFERSFSDVQKSGLKDVTKKLRKANSDVTKQSKALTQGPGHSKIDSKQIADIAERLDKALSDFQRGQLAVGTEMGIQSEGSTK